MEVSTGIHTFGEVLELASIEVDQSFDRRRISVGGLTFDDPAETFKVPEGASELVIKLDGVEHATFTVK